MQNVQHEISQGWRLCEHIASCSNSAGKHTFVGAMWFTTVLKLSRFTTVLGFFYTTDEELIKMFEPLTRSFIVRYVRTQCSPQQSISLSEEGGRHSLICFGPVFAYYKYVVSFWLHYMSVQPGPPPPACSLRRIT